MLNFKKILIILVVFALAALFCFIEVNKQVADQRLKYSSQLSTQINEYLAQQAYILQRLGKALTPAIKNHSLKNISDNLSAYEEVLFVLAKQDLVIPLSVQLVSLDAPQQIVGSVGLLDRSVLAPDENYYIEVVAQPKVLQLSPLYQKQDMPDYWMLNLGLGIVDDANNYLGHLDVKLSVAALSDYLRKHGLNSQLFSFKFVHSLVQPQINLNKTSYVIMGMQYTLVRLLWLTLLLALLYIIYRAFSNIRSRALQSELDHKKINTLEQQLACTKAAIEVQHNYGVLVNCAIDEIQIIEIQQLLKDIKLVNANFAIENGVELIFPEYNSKIMRFYGQQVRLMQILSGILHEMIGQNAIGGRLELTVTLSDSHNGQQRIIFSFTDNGFYDSLQDQALLQSAADIRCKGWANILQLIEQENGTLEHTHTAYVGNTVAFTIMKKMVNNVVNLEAYSLLG